MSKNSCTHKNFWEIYKVINFNRNFCEENGREFICSSCDKKCVLKWKGYKKMKKNTLKKYFTYFLWLLPAIILIACVASGKLHFLWAIFAIIAFHFGAMWYIINSDRLVIKCK